VPVDSGGRTADEIGRLLRRLGAATIDEVATLDDLTTLRAG
jgi:hypothetical protein